MDQELPLSCTPGRRCQTQSAEPAVTQSEVVFHCCVVMKLDYKSGGTYWTTTLHSRCTLPFSWGRVLPLFPHTVFKHFAVSAPVGRAWGSVSTRWWCPPQSRAQLHRGASWDVILPLAATCSPAERDTLQQRQWPQRKNSIGTLNGVHCFFLGISPAMNLVLLLLLFSIGVVYFVNGRWLQAQC